LRGIMESLESFSQMQSRIGIAWPQSVNMRRYANEYLEKVCVGNLQWPVSLWCGEHLHLREWCGLYAGVARPIAQRSEALQN